MYFKRDRYLHVFVLIVMLQYSTLKAATIGLQPEGTRCACAGDMLIYNCSIMGGFTTLWKGTAFDCPLDDSEITLRHSQFAANQEIGICNNGDIEGRSIGVANDCYTSQLNIMTVRERFNNKTVQCASVSLVETTNIGESLLSVPSATNPYPPPDNVYLADAQPGILVFNWTTVISNCSTAFLQYSITFDCGACPTVTNLTTATCSHLQLTTNANMCHFRVSSHTCGFAGNPSSPTLVTLKVPDVPQVEIVPSYSSESQAIQKLFIVMTVNQTEDHFYISGNISGFPTSYTAYGSNRIRGTSFNSTVSLASCEEAGGCPIEVPSSHCSQPTTINVTISAANKLGEGPCSSLFMIECTNDFVQVVYREISTISCVFLNQSDTSEKTCCVTYGPCDQREPGNTPIYNCSRDSSYNIPLEIPDLSSQRYCYTVTASNDTHIVKVEGTFTLGGNIRGNSHTAAITAGVIVPITISILLLGTVMLNLIACFAIRRKYMHTQSKSSKVEYVKATPVPLPESIIYPQSPLEPYLTPYTIPARTKLHEVDGDNNLRDFVIKISDSKSFRKGHAYYEFTNEREDILEGTNVLLQDKKKKEKWFQLVQPKDDDAGDINKFYGVGITRSSFEENYTVFIQSFGSGARHLPDGSSILYNHDDQDVIFCSDPDEASRAALQGSVSPSKYEHHHNIL